MDLSAVVLPDLLPEDFLHQVAEIERLRLRGAWTYDHLSWRDLRDGPWFGSVPLLAAAATQTSTVRLGFLVASPNFRHPVPFAKELLTLDHLSTGRLDVGLGAGGTGADSTVLGDPPLSPRDRTDRFVAFIRALDELLRWPRVDLTEGAYTAVDARMIPGCVQRPRVPITVAAAGPRTLDLAARIGDGWVSYGPSDPAGDWYEGLRAQSDLLNAACDRHGRDRGSIRRTALVGLDEPHLADPGRLLDTLSGLGFDELAVHWPRADGRAASHAQIEALVGRTSA